MRQDPISKEWVIFSSARKSRPHHVKTDSANHQLPRYDPNCPFCPGNEKMLPGILFETLGIGDQQWSTRSVPNLYPALSPEGNIEREKPAFTSAWSLRHHEVIIDHPAITKESISLNTSRCNPLLKRTIPGTKN